MTQFKQIKKAGLSLGLTLTRIVFVLIVSFPFVWMFLTSFKTMEEYFTYPIRWLPKTWTLRNYYAIAHETEFLISLKNSLILALGVSVVAITLALIAAYGFDRFRFKGKNAILFTILSFQFFPLIVFIIPYYVLLLKLNLLNSLWGLFCAYMPLSLPLSVWMLRSFIRQVPRSIEEAAMVDGCTTIGTLFRITLPVMKPQVISTFLLSFVTIWEEYMMASVFTSTTLNRTLPVHLTYYMREMTTDWGSLMAASVVMTLPLIIPFVILSRYFRTGLTAGSVKG